MGAMSSSTTETNLDENGKENRDESATASRANQPLQNANESNTNVDDSDSASSPEAAAAAAAIASVASNEQANDTKTTASSSPSAPQKETKRKQPPVQYDSEIEDVTDQYVKKRRLSPEIIEVEDVSSDEEDVANIGTCKNSRNNNSQNFGAARARGGKSDNNSNQSSDESDDDSDGESILSDSSIEDVTEFMLAKKKEQIIEEINGAIELDSGSEDDRKKSRKRKSRSKHRKRKVAESPIEVLIDAKDVPTCPGQRPTDEEDEGRCSTHEEDSNDVDHSIKQRIVKLLNTGFHAESNENEARNAMKLARRLMERYNLDQSALLQERGDGSLNDFSTTTDDKDGPSGLRGGIVGVTIQHSKNHMPLHSLPRWMDFLVQPICANFHVEAFKSLARGNKYRGGECTVSFYGIRTNAQLAAYAFKIAAERISLMTALYEPATRGGKETRNARLSYSLGIVIGLDRDVTESLRREEERRKSKLNRARRAAESEDACRDSDDDVSADGDDSDNAMTLEQLETENTAQLALVDHQKKIAADVLKSNNIKVGAGRKVKSMNVNIHAYEKGIVDSKEIDLNQQAIGGS